MKTGNEYKAEIAKGESNCPRCGTQIDDSWDGPEMEGVYCRQEASCMVCDLRFVVVYEMVGYMVLDDSGGIESQHDTERK